MNANKFTQKNDDALNMEIEKGLQAWLEKQIPKMIDDEVEKMKANGAEVAVDEESLAQTKKDMADVIKSLFQ